MSTITPDSPVPGGRYVVTAETPGGYRSETHYGHPDASHILRKGDVVVIRDDDAAIDEDGDVSVNVPRTGNWTYVRFAHLTPEGATADEPELAPISEVDVEAFRDAIDGGEALLRESDVRRALLDFGFSPIYAEALVATVRTRQADGS